MKKLMALVLALVLAMGCLAGCTGGTGGQTPSGGDGDQQGQGGKILYLSNLSSGANYDFYVAYLEMACNDLGYTFEVIYGDPSNDPAGNLSAVKNAMTNDVVGLIVCQDGGIVDIMNEYPDLYVVGAATDLASVYGEGGASAACATNEKFLGGIADGLIDGNDIGKGYAQTVIEKGYKKVSICIFPAFAYPQNAVADKAFREEIAAYNETVSDAEKIEIVGDEPTVLMFSPLDSTYFNEPEHQDLDAVVAILAGQQFVYPTMIEAVGSGLITNDTKLITGGFESSQEFLDEFGTEDGLVQALHFSTPEKLIYSLALLDNAIQGKQYADYEAEVVSSPQWIITDRETFDAVINNSGFLDCDMSKLALSWEEAKEYFTRYNPDATYADLKELLASDRLTAEYFVNN